MPLLQQRAQFAGGGLWILGVQDGADDGEAGGAGFGDGGGGFEGYAAMANHGTGRFSRARAWIRASPATSPSGFVGVA